jgi:Multicopper oxidase
VSTAIKCKGLKKR